ncbi:site-specific integrase [Malikia spinosa]|uniref:site-specific integrase n=1 Tax=Malikia spinosa TaxID=86180 RepID=UPI000A3F5A00
MASSPVRGIQEIQWTRKDGTVGTAYRVRITRKDFKGQRSKVFDNFNEAKEYLTLSKTVRGKRLIYSVEQTEEEKYKLDNENRNNFTFEHFTRLYIRDYIETKPSATELQRRSKANIISFFNTILRTSILDRTSTYQEKEELGIGDPENPIYKFFGTYDIRKINPIDINNYIRTRKRMGMKPISIQREITQISNVFNKVKYFSEFLEGLKNPCRDYDRDLIKNNSLKRERFLSDEEIKFIFDDFKNYSNSELYQICNLSLITSMRRSEVITLKQEQVKENYIQLIHTKSGKPRKVYLTKEAQEFLATLKPKTKDGRFFTYTITGFDRIFRAQVLRLKLDLKFHDFRKTSISRTISKADGNSLLVANILGFSSVRKFDELHVRSRLMTTDTQLGALRTFGHDNPDITNKHYLTPILDDVNKIKKLNELKEKQKLNNINPEEKEELLFLLIELTKTNV